MYAKPPNNTRFKPGQSGNPNGRPRKLNEQDMLITLQKIMALYVATQSKDKTIRHPAYYKLKQIKNLLSN